ncbi:hypothetical protein NDU88_002499 [Pleurodeles waltl]|uniref:Uncharacterized protein n=1 Tax=Pleurodeles waltl TaxID=8319 RepID=A0AAV7Q6U4_PLEWA|nr:hypothetical protein NDU88_002499 [Pleurodeles waltl]
MLSHSTVPQGAECRWVPLRVVAYTNLGGGHCGTELAGAFCRQSPTALTEPAVPSAYALFDLRGGARLVEAGPKPRYLPPRGQGRPVYQRVSAALFGPSALIPAPHQPPTNCKWQAGLQRA